MSPKPKRLPADVVPREMLDLCRNTLRIALARAMEVQAELEEAREEIARLKRKLREWR